MKNKKVLGSTEALIITTLLSGFVLAFILEYSVNFYFVVLSQFVKDAIYPSYQWWGYYIIAPIAIVVISIISIWILIKNSHLVAIIKQFTYAKLRGVWDDDYLDDQIRENFKNSSIIKIKVTRGSNLFVKENNSFYRCLIDSTNEFCRFPKTVQVLLHYPCLQSAHLQQRAEANGESVKEYFNSVFSVAKKLDEANKREHMLNITVKLYGDEKVKWRYYVFKDREEKEEILFLNYYDDDSPGAKSPMLKVIGQKDTLCDDFNKSFDDIFNNSSSSVLVSKGKPLNKKAADYHKCGHIDCLKLIQNSLT